MPVTTVPSSVLDRFPDAAPEEGEQPTEEEPDIGTGDDMTDKSGDKSGDMDKSGDESNMGDKSGDEDTDSNSGDMGDKSDESGDSTDAGDSLPTIYMKAMPLDVSDGFIIYQLAGKTYTVELSDLTRGNYKAAQHPLSTVDPGTLMRYFVLEEVLYKEPLNIGLDRGPVPSAVRIGTFGPVLDLVYSTNPEGQGVVYVLLESGVIKSINFNTGEVAVVTAITDMSPTNLQFANGKLSWVSEPSNGRLTLTEYDVGRRTKSVIAYVGGREYTAMPGNPGYYYVVTESGVDMIDPRRTR